MNDFDPRQLTAQITFLSTRDMAATHAFYADTLGLELILEQSGCRIYRTVGEAYLGFCTREEFATEGIIVTLVLDDVEGAAQALRTAGITLEKEPAFNPKYNIVHAFLRDPSGYLVEIQRFEDPRWPAPSTRSR